MGLFGLALLGTAFTFAMTALGAALVFLLGSTVSERMNRLCLGFAGGVMSAASVFSLLLPAMEQGATWRAVSLGFALGAGIMTGLDALLERFALTGDEPSKRRALLFSAVTMHNIPEGMAVGLAFALCAQGEALAGACALALGVGVQNFPEGAAISLPLYQSGVSRRRSFALGALSGAVEPVAGAAAALCALALRGMMPMLMAVSAGAMMWAVFCEMTPEAGKRRDGALAGLVGFLVMMAMDTAFG